MAWFILARAIFVRVLFTIHGLVTIWRLYVATDNAQCWYITAALAGLLVETVITIRKKRGQEWKWLCPSVVFYLLCVVPAIWFLELHELKTRIRIQSQFKFNGTLLYGNETEALSAKFPGIGLEIIIPVKLTPERWVRVLEQILLLILILGRWVLPKGKLTHDQLSQLLLVYIGTAGDIVEFFESFKEEEVKYNEILCICILSIWSWSLLQFTLVMTAYKARKDKSGLYPSRGSYDTPSWRRDHGGCIPDVYGIVISICLQDAPFLVFRMVLIFKYHVLSYTNMFFTCKNSLVCSLLLYRLSVVQWERRSHRWSSLREVTSSNSGMRLIMSRSATTDEYYNYKTIVKLSERPTAGNSNDVKEGVVDYVIKRHYSCTDDAISDKKDDYDDINDLDDDINGRVIVRRLTLQYDNDVICDDEEKGAYDNDVTTCEEMNERTNADGYDVISEEKDAEEDVYNNDVICEELDDDKDVITEVSVC